ncbi:hypothetical protein EU527_12680 [Candidatus Thorarchaeota archaeon]|nr:MAG: hypothetical protein EU527_12680 [Candidatus Thorarchaeota archaeon]
MEYYKLKETELFSFFHFTETGRRPQSRGMTEIHLKPGGFQEFIDISMKVDSKEGVHEGILLLDRDWIGGPMTVNPFGKDLAKSFVEAVTHPKDKEEACSVITTIWNLTGSKNKREYLHEKKSKCEEQIDKLMNVYLGTEKCYSLELENCKIVVENVEDVGRSRLKIIISSLER